MSNAVDKLLFIARGEIGVKEFPASSNNTKYGKWYGWNGVPWCGIFVSYCYYRSGSPLPPIQSSLGFAYCPFAVKYYKREHRYYQTPEPGDMMFFDWGKDGVVDHVGIVESVAGNIITTIEGNTGNSSENNGGQVMRRQRQLGAKYVHGFARPELKTVKTAVTASDKIKIPYPNQHYFLTSPWMRDNWVKTIQTALVSNAYKLDTDGIFGPDTARAVTGFQLQKGLEPDGIVGRHTWNALFKE